MKIALVAGARPNFMKIAPLAREMEKRGLLYIIVHTGQHYDYNMSRIFFDELGIPEPHYHLGIGSDTNNRQTARAMLALEDVFEKEKPELVVVVGDVNSTLAGALTAVRMGIPAAHVEAGLRSFDRSMPEEINRVLTDAVCDLLFTPSRDADENLLREGIDPSRIHFVGNIMIDTLVLSMEKADNSKILERLNLSPKSYVYLTLHRPNNVDDPDMLRRTIDSLKGVGRMGFKIVFPLHPRTRKNLSAFGLEHEFLKIPGLIATEPLGYIDSLALTKNALVVITDSGGLQEETTYLGVPCLTLRPNTERPITITVGTNQLLSKGPEEILENLEDIANGNIKNGSVPELWDGKTAERIVSIVVNI